LAAHILIFCVNFDLKIVKSVVKNVCIIFEPSIDFVTYYYMGAGALSSAASASSPKRARERIIIKLFNLFKNMKVAKDEEATMETPPPLDQVLTDLVECFDSNFISVTELVAVISKKINIELSTEEFDNFLQGIGSENEFRFINFHELLETLGEELGEPFSPKLQATKRVEDDCMNISYFDLDHNDENNNNFTSLKHLVKIPNWIKTEDDNGKLPLTYFASIGDLASMKLIVEAASSPRSITLLINNCEQHLIKETHQEVDNYLESLRMKNLEVPNVEEQQQQKQSPVASPKQKPTPKMLAKAGDLAALIDFDLNNEDFDWKNEKHDSFDSCSLYYACHSGARGDRGEDLVNFIIEKKGGIGNIPERVLARCRKNSINPAISGILTDTPKKKGGGGGRKVDAVEEVEADFGLGLLFGENFDY